MNTSPPLPSPGPLDVAGLLRGARLLVVGGTGFLGKVWLSLLLCRYPEIGHVYLVVRPKRRAGLSPEEASEARFWSEIASSRTFDPLRALHPGAAFEAFLREKLTPIPGDVSEPHAGLSPALLERLRGTITALVNASGVVDFNPPLDESLNVNAFGMQNLVSLARALGDVPFLHTSTCYVAGDRTGQVDEVDPRYFPFPKADELEVSHWDPEREIAECVDLVEHVRHRANDAFRQSAFLDQARRTLTERGEPTRGTALEDELAKVKRRYEEEQLVAAGTERARYWGWHNIYTYTKSIGEQILCRSGLRYTIVRPAVVESAETFPVTGWNEGINTSAPVIYLAIQAPGVFPAEKDSVLDIVPVDQVAYGLTLALAELIEGTAPSVYQLGTSDTNPCHVARLIELVGLYKRRHYLDKASGNALVNWAHAHWEPVPIDAAGFFKSGPQSYADKVKSAAGFLKKLAAGPLQPLLGPAVEGLEGAARQLGVSARIIEMFVPFMATHNYRFSSANTRAAFARLSPEDREKLPWAPERMDWRVYFHEVHCPGLERHVWPEIKAKLDRKTTPLRRYDDLLDLLDEVAERYELQPALLLTHEDGFARVSYRDLRTRAAATAARLKLAGVGPGDRVLLSGQNHPDWVIAYFGILWAGGVAVPVDPALAPDAARRVAEAAEIAVALLDDKASESFGNTLVTSCYALSEATAPLGPGEPEPGPRARPGPDAVASVLFTSGTTGVPKGVMLTHGNFASLLASLSKLFDLGADDRVLSVLPLHHTFEFSCGLLLPLSRGTRILYLDEVNGEKLSYGLREGRVTAMVGVPALWQLLERRIRGQVRDQGRLFEAVVDAGLDLNRMIGSATGLDAGRLFFAPVHARLGGNIRYLISGGAALPAETHKLFSGLGLHLAEGYGLTEAAPVLTVARGRPGERAGHVGKPIPGVEIRVLEPDDKGIGEVVARGPNVMAGYWGDERATQGTIDADGWLHTGDLGYLDHQGRLHLVGRAKEVVVTASGENIYLEDLEARLGRVSGVSEYAFVGLPDPRGGERLGLLAVPEETTNGERAQGHAAAKAALKAAIEALPAWQRPSVTHLVDAPLPRTATRKVKRKEVREVLERISAAAPATAPRGDVASPVAHAIAAVAGRHDGKVSATLRMKEDLGFDSLMWVELSAALDALDGSPGVDALSRCETVADVVRLAGQASTEAREVEPEPERFEIPEPLVGPLKAALSLAQRTLYHQVLDMRVTGSAYIPQNRPVIVVSNHASHLDMGLVKMALGPYGQRVVALAAKDYFFEGNKWLVAYFDQLTNLKPLDRKAGFRASFEQARQVVEEGNVVLLFPEGTRSPDGSLQPFKPLVGKLALETGVDLLPLWLGNTHTVLPKGALLPRGRKVSVAIGPPLCIEDLRRLTAGKRHAEAARVVSRLAQQAVEALRDGKVLDLQSLSPEQAAEDARPAPPKIEDVVNDLVHRFDPARVEQPVTWYFSLGGEGGPRWTISVRPEGCEVKPGRPAGSADCVVKTSEDLFTRMVRQAYVPEPAEFFSGAIKTNEIPLLIEFARVFNLSDPGSTIG